MEMPVKISPDRLIRTFIEIRYSSKLPIELSIGAFYNKFDETYFYAGSKDQKEIKFVQLENGTTKVSCPEVYLFFNDRIKIECLNDRFIFDMNDVSREREYIGWKSYYDEIAKAVEVFSSVGAINQYKQIGIRYIGEYNNIPLSLLLKEGINSNLPIGNVINKFLLYEGTYEEVKYKIRLQENSDKTNIKSSIDIDVIMQEISINDTQELLTKINTIHTIEKEIFFEKIISPVYLSKITTEY